MAKKNISSYLDKLEGYSKKEELIDLYGRWKNDLEINTFLVFLNLIGFEKNNIKPKYLGENEYNNFRGVALEEFCYDKLNKLINESGMVDLIQLFRNEKILIEEFFVFKDRKFNKIPKYKNVDIIVGKKEGNLIHPLMIISCKVWQSANWLDEDRAVFDNVRNRYPYVLGYSLCTSIIASSAALISSQRTGLKIFDLSKEDKFPEIISDIKEILAYR